MIPLVIKFGARPVVICGGLLVAVGYVSSAFVFDIHGMMVMYGIVAGKGMKDIFASHK